MTSKILIIKTLVIITSLVSGYYLLDGYLNSLIKSVPHPITDNHSVLIPPPSNSVNLERPPFLEEL